MTLTDCTGPFGMVHHSGDITVTFSKNADGSLHAQAASSNMTINGKAATYSADSDITVDAATKTVTIKHNGAWTRENAKGETVKGQPTRIELKVSAPPTKRQLWAGRSNLIDLSIVPQARRHRTWGGSAKICTWADLAAQMNVGRKNGPRQEGLSARVLLEEVDGAAGYWVDRLNLEVARAEAKALFAPSGSGRWDNTHPFLNAIHVAIVSQ